MAPVSRQVLARQGAFRIRVSQPEYGLTGNRRSTMLKGFDTSLEEKLRIAEQAELEVTRLQPLAAEAPQLRADKAKAHRTAERQRARETAMQQAKKAAEGAAEKQSQVPELLGTAARAVNDLYTVLREIESRRHDAMQALAVADRVDYDTELEDGEAQEISQDRDPRGLAYALAARHGDGRVKRLLEDLDPGFSLMGGCNLDDPLYRDVASFVTDRVAVAVPPQTAKKK
jgi:hypothetical protein